jgi:hypothetical protein
MVVLKAEYVFVLFFISLLFFYVRHGYKVNRRVIGRMRGL